MMKRSYEMSNEISQEQREKIIFQLTESLNFTSDEYLIKLMEEVSVDYAKGYLDAFIANARDDEILLFYQFVKIIDMV